MEVFIRSGGGIKPRIMPAVQVMIPIEPVINVPFLPPGILNARWSFGNCEYSFIAAAKNKT